MQTLTNTVFQKVSNFSSLFIEHQYCILKNCFWEERHRLGDSSPYGVTLFSEFYMYSMFIKSRLHIRIRGILYIILIYRNFSYTASMNWYNKIMYQAPFVFMLLSTGILKFLGFDHFEIHDLLLIPNKTDRRVHV